jgi:hypothetical protein
MPQKNEKLQKNNIDGGVNKGKIPVSGKKPKKIVW